MPSCVRLLAVTDGNIWGMNIHNVQVIRGYLVMYEKEAWSMSREQRYLDDSSRLRGAYFWIRPLGKPGFCI